MPQCIIGFGAIGTSLALLVLALVHSLQPGRDISQFVHANLPWIEGVATPMIQPFLAGRTEAAHKRACARTGGEGASAAAALVMRPSCAPPRGAAAPAPHATCAPAFRLCSLLTYTRTTFA